MTYYTSLGQTPGSPRDRARALYTEGNTAYQAGNMELALTKFTQAYQAFTLPAVLIAIAETLLRLGRMEEAKNKAERYLNADPNGTQAAQARSIVDVVAAKTSTSPTRVPAHADIPLAPAEDVYAERSTKAIWVITGVGILGIIGFGWYALRSSRPKPNRRRRTSRR